MKITKTMWDMPITIEITDSKAQKADIEEIFKYFEHIDTVFNTFDKTSEISQINAGKISKENWSDEVKEVISLCEKTLKETNGYFEHERNGIIDPLGLVKGWAVKNAADKLSSKGYENYYVEAGGDIQVRGHNQNGEPWVVGIRSPFKLAKIIKVLSLTDCGIATSGSYMRGNHVYNPIQGNTSIPDVVSMTVIAQDVLEADRFATPAFAMGKQGINFIESMPNLEGYMINEKGIATYTSSFEKYVRIVTSSNKLAEAPQ